MPLVLALLVGCIGDRHVPPQQPIGLPTEPTTPAMPATPATPTTPPIPPTPPTPWDTTFPVQVTVVTRGAELDPDGYVVEVTDVPGEALQQYQERSAIGTNGATQFLIPGGVYVADLSGVAPNCTSLPPRTFFVNYFSGLDEEQAPLTLGVTCLAIPATQGVRVTTTTTGTVDDTVSFGVRVLALGDDTGPRFHQRRPIGANESVRMPSPAGSFYVVLDVQAMWKKCTINVSDVQRVEVEPNQMAAASFNVACAP
jgi:hypothetical protein